MGWLANINYGTTMKLIQLNTVRTFLVLMLVAGLSLTACTDSSVSSVEDGEVGMAVQNLETGSVTAEQPETITLTGVIRDFKASGTDGGHPDFQRTGSTCGTATGIVENTLVDGKPVYSGEVTCNTTSAERFNQWYNDVDGVNLRTTHDFVLELQNDGTYTYSNNSYFPIDGELFGNQQGFNDDNGVSHNFHFTTEIHTTFTYTGGESFSFSGDDDVWVFINDELVIDLGGVHPEINGSINLDDLNIGLEVGEDYSLDIFQAERNTTGSNFSFTTSLQLVSEPVEPNSAPNADAGEYGTIEATGTTTSVTLDGSGSSDPDEGDELSYTWEVNGETVSGETAEIDLSIGSYEVSLTVTDQDGASNTDTATVVVKDTTAPVLTVNQQVESLWPPNHKMVLVASISATDAVDNNPTIDVEIDSNESSNGRGDGNTDSDYDIVTNFDGTVDVYVRSERSGKGKGRTYTISTSVEDSSGNISDESFEVQVAKSQGKKGR